MAQSRDRKAKPEIVLTKSGRKLTIWYVSVGQCFGTAAQLRSGKTVVAQTETASYGFTSVCRDRALALARSL